VTGHSLGSNAVPGPRRGRAVAWALGAMALGTGFVSMLTIRGRPAAPPPPGIVSMTAIESRSVAPPTTPTAGATTVPVPEPFAPPPSASAVMVAPKASAHPVHLQKKKPVATTPGF
jgi:hypothetical protein